MLEALLFDFDGTIAETERDGHRVAYNRAFADLELPWFWNEADYGVLLAIAGGKERIAHFIARDGLDVPGGDEHALIERLHRRKAERFAELADGIALRPGVARLIAEAKAAGLKLAIATTAGESGVRAVLAKSPETLDAFDAIAAGDVVPHKKPAPDIYVFALEAIRVAPSDAIAFEDTAIGLAAARAAGLTTIALPSTYSQGESFAEARAIFDGFDRVTIPFLRSL